MKTLYMLILSFTLCFAQEQTAVPFLKLSPSAKANGMAGAYCAVSNDASAMYFNPAGLTQMQLAALIIFIQKIRIR
jgi:hypothetical protein